MDAAIAWEDWNGRFVDRLWTTVWLASSDPIATFGRLGAATGERDLAAGARFALLVSLIGWAPLLLLSPCLAVVPIAFASWLPERAQAVGAGVAVMIILAIPIVFVLSSVGFELFYGLLFHLFARLFGGVGDLRGSMHAMLYTSAIRFWLCPGIFLGFIPFIGTMISVALRTGFMIWGGVACYGTARSLHRLADGPAIGVAVLTPLSASMVVAVLVAISVLGIVALVVGTASFGELFQQGGT